MNLTDYEIFLTKQAIEQVKECNFNKDLKIALDVMEITSKYNQTITKKTIEPKADFEEICALVESFMAFMDKDYHDIFKYGQHEIQVMNVDDPENIISASFYYNPKNYQKTIHLPIYGCLSDAYDFIHEYFHLFTTFNNKVNLETFDTLTESSALGSEIIFTKYLQKEGVINNNPREEINAFIMNYLAKKAYNKISLIQNYYQTGEIKEMGLKDLQYIWYSQTASYKRELNYLKGYLIAGMLKTKNELCDLTKMISSGLTEQEILKNINFDDYNINQIQKTYDLRK